MKNIQWFPGHMTRAMRDMEAKRDLCDGVICVLDARAPIATVNKKVDNPLVNPLVMSAKQY